MTAGEELTAKYRHVFFDSQPGREVLADILDFAHFMGKQEANDPRRIAGQNLCITILQRCGILSEGTSMREIVDALAQILPKPQEDVR